jgi:cyanophycinase
MTLRRLLHSLLALVAPVALVALALAATPAPVLAQGSTLAIGGALRDDNHAVWQRLVQLAGGRGACVSVFATASSEPDASAANIAANLARHGARGQHIRIAPRLPGMDAQALAAAVRDPAWVARVRQCRGVFFSGGAQERLLDTLAPGGQDSPLLRAMREVWQRGGVVAGTSSGAAVLSAIAFRDAPDPLAVMKGRLRAGQEWAPGFGFAPVLIDQHFVRRGRIARLLPLMQAQGLALGLGVEENSAALIRGTKVEVLGASGVLVADLSAASSEPRLPAFNLRGARLHWLQAGDRYDLAARQAQPAGRQLPRTAAAPENPEVLPDMLGEAVFVRAMRALQESGALRGVSFAVRPASDDPAPDIGFEWRLWTDDDTSAWRTAAGITVLNARLDIVPLRMQQPLYQPIAIPTAP